MSHDVDVSVRSSSWCDCRVYNMMSSADQNDDSSSFSRNSNTSQQLLPSVECSNSHTASSVTASDRVVCVGSSWPTAAENNSSCVLDRDLLNDVSADNSQQQLMSDVQSDSCASPQSHNATAVCSSLLPNGCSGVSVNDQLSIAELSVSRTDDGVKPSMPSEWETDEAAASESAIEDHVKPSDVNEVKQSVVEIAASNVDSYAQTDCHTDEVHSEETIGKAMCHVSDTHSLFNTSSDLFLGNKSSPTDVDGVETSGSKLSNETQSVSSAFDQQQHGATVESGTDGGTVTTDIECSGRAEDMTNCVSECDEKMSTQSTATDKSSSLLKDTAAAAATERDSQSVMSTSAVQSSSDVNTECEVVSMANDSDQCCCDTSSLAHPWSHGDGPVVVSTTDVISQTAVSSRSSYLTTAVSISSLPLQSLADLVHKVTVFSVGDHKKPGGDMDVVRNSPLYCSRVNYMNTCLTSHTHDALILQSSWENVAPSEFKKPSRCLAYNRQARGSSKAEHNGDIVTSAGHQSDSYSQPAIDGVDSAGDMAADKKSQIHECSEQTGEARCKLSMSGRKSSSPGRCQHQRRCTTKCKVDAVDVNFLKDLIVACTGHELVTNSCGMTEPVSGHEKFYPLCDKPNKSDETLAVSGTKMSKRQRKQRKGAPLRRETATKILSNITLIDVAAVNSCVERDYSEFVKSIKQCSDNKTAQRNSVKNRKKTRMQDDSDKGMTVVSEVSEKERCSVKSRRRRKMEDVADVCAEQCVKSSRSRNNNQQAHDTVDDNVLVDKCTELSVTDTAAVDSAVAKSSVTKSPQDTSIPNCSAPTARKRGQPKKKKRSDVSEVKTEVIVTATRSQRKRNIRQVSQEPHVECTNTEDLSTESNVARLNNSADEGATQVTSACSKKKCRSSKRNCAAMSEDCEHSSTIDHSIADNVVCRKSWKCKAQSHVLSVVAYDVLCEPELKHLRKMASDNDTALQAVDTVAELAGTVMTDANLESTQQQAQSDSLQPVQLESLQQATSQSSQLNKGTPAHKDWQQKKKKKEKKASGFEAQKKSNKNKEDDKITGEDSETKEHASKAVIDAVSEPELLQLVTTAISRSLGSGGAVDTGTVVAHDDTEYDKNNMALTYTHDNTAITAATVTNKASDAGDEKLFACVKCSYKARKKGQLRKHLSVHKMFICAHCVFTVDTQSGLDDHMAASHPSRCGRRLCKRCHMLYRAGTVFTQHMEQCTGIKTAWQCPACQKHFKFISAMRTHIQRWHSGIDASVDHGQMTSDATDTDSHRELPPSDTTNHRNMTCRTGNAAEHGEKPASDTTNHRDIYIYTYATNDTADDRETSVTSDVTDNNVRLRSSSVAGMSADATVESAATLSAAGPVLLLTNNLPSPSLAVKSSICTSLPTDSTILPTSLTVLSGPASPGLVVAASLISKRPVHTDINQLMSVAPVVSVQTESQPLSSALSSAANTNGELRYFCEHCPKSFKAKRSMVHHRRMFHEGGQQRKKEAAATAAKMPKVDDGENAMVAEGSNETLPAGDLVNEDIEKMMTLPALITDDQTATVVRNNLALSTAELAVRAVYSCNFVDCHHTFRRLEQLQRHEERHAMPGTCVCVCAAQLSWYDITVLQCFDVLSGRLHNIRLARRNWQCLACTIHGISWSSCGKTRSVDEGHVTLEC